jgi:transposase
VVPSLSFKLEQLNEALTSEHKKESTIMTQETRFVGLDVGKFEIYAFDAGRDAEIIVTNTGSGHLALADWLGDPNDIVIALESTGGYEWMVWQNLNDAGFDARQVSAAHVRSFSRASGALAKTDPIDARLIARFIAFRPTAGRKPPAYKVREINRLNVKRRQLVEMRKRLRCQVKQRHSPQLDEMDTDLLDLLTQQIADLEGLIETAISSCQELSNRAKILRTIPGIGPVLMANLIGDLPELGHCSDKQIAALAGLAPINNDSGKMAGKRAIKGGRYAIRGLFYQAALVASNHNPVLRIFAKRLREKGKPHKVVLIAVARKLLIIANVLVAKNAVWEPN